jgi:phosphatidate cytidylyltransferase
MDETDIGGGEGGRRDLAARLGPDLGPRLASGLVLAAGLAVVIWAGRVAFDAFVVLLAMALSWEWGRLVAPRETDIVSGVTIVAVGAAGVLAACAFVGLGLLLLTIGAILVVVLSLGNNAPLGGAGVFYAGLPALAVIWLRADAAQGVAGVVFLLVVIAVSDTAAFFCGRLLGGPRLWPRVSPNKTWAGLLGAIVLSALFGALYCLAVPAASPLRLAAIAAALALLAQAGDLAESALKRHFGAKDSGRLIPGHGGIMDRVDGVVAAAPVAALIGLAINVHWPARALLLGF